MTQAAIQLRDQLAALPEQDRAVLALFLLQSIEPSAADDDDSELDQALALREQEIRSGAVEGVPAEELISQLRTEFP